MSRAIGARLSNAMWGISVCTGATSLISAAQRVFDVGLISFFQEFVSYYRRLTYPIIEFLPNLLHIHLPNWYKDLYVISFVLLMISVRAIEVHKHGPKLKLISYVTILLVSAISSFAFLGFRDLYRAILNTSIISPVLIADKKLYARTDDEIEEILRTDEKMKKTFEIASTDLPSMMLYVRIVRGTFITFFAAALFFVLNAFFS